jgi:hypothetical protein
MNHVTEVVVESLAGVPAGVELEVVQTLFPGSPALAGERALREGSRWRCRLNGQSVVLLHNRAGRLVSLRRDEARYIRVRRVSEAGGS